MVSGTAQFFGREREDNGSRVTGAGGAILIVSMTAGRNAISMVNKSLLQKVKKR